VTGEVEDVRPFIERSAVVIVPLRAGGGSRVKILEAFACGRPVVATRVGAEGLEVEDGAQLLIEDDPDAFAKAVMSLLTNPERRRELVRAARLLVERRYGWTGIAEAQAQLWNEAIEDSNEGHALGDAPGASNLAG
jgi:glycosyltransferase involved in cell wall biosynthesis